MRPALLVLSTVVCAPALIAADGAEPAPEARTASLPEFALEYDVDKAFDDRGYWSGGLRVSGAVGVFAAEGFTALAPFLDDDNADIMAVSLTWTRPVRRELSTFGVYFSVGATMQEMTWDLTNGGELTASSLGARLAGGYGFGLGGVMIETGIFGEFGMSESDDFTIGSTEYTGDSGTYQAIGLEFAAVYSFAHGQGAEIGVMGQFDLREARVAHDIGVVDSAADDISGYGMLIGLTAGWRF